MATKLEILTDIGNAMHQEPGYCFMSEASVKTFVKQGLVETNTSIQDEDFRVAVRLTDKGLAFVANSVPAVPTIGIPATSTSSEKKNMSSFEIVTGVEIPKSKRGGNLNGGRKCKYPFDLLEVGQMFFVPATEKTPEPWKSMVGVVSGANKRYATAGESTRINRKGEEVPVLVYTRRFVLRQIAKDGAAGAGIWREA